MCWRLDLCVYGYRRCSTGGKASQIVVLHSVAASEIFNFKTLSSTSTLAEAAACYVV